MSSLARLCGLYSLPFLSILTHNLLKQCASVTVGFFVWGQDYGGGYSVAGFHVE